MIPRGIAAWFSTELREAGRACYADDRVRLGHASAAEVAATVRGRETFLVTIGFDDQARKVSLSCSCSFAASFGACKHMWAVLEAADAAEMLTSRDGDDERDRSDYSVRQPHWFEPLRVRPFQSVTSRRDRGRNDWKRQLRVLDAGESARLRAIASWSQPAYSRPSVIDDRGTIAPPTATRRARGPEKLHYIVDLDETVKKAALRVEVVAGQPAARQPGDWSSIHATDLRECQDEEDRLIVELLLGASGERNRHQFNVPAASFDITLRRMIETGHCRFRSLQFPDLNGNPVQLENPPPWQLRLHIREDREQDGWRVDPVLSRNGDDIPLRDFHTLTPGGISIIRQRLAIVDTRLHWRFLEGMRLHPPLIAPRDQLHALASALFGMPDAPDIQLPEGHGLQIVRSAPRPCLVIVNDFHQRDLYYRDIALIFDYEGVRVQFGQARDDARRVSGRTIIARDAETEFAAAQRLVELGATVWVAPGFSGPPHIAIAMHELRALRRTLEGEGWLVGSGAPGTFQVTQTASTA
jgi:hypothetical protein